MSYGIIRYHAGSGSVPEDDNAAFDGWYTNARDARAVYKMWCEEHPGWILALVTAKDLRFPK